MMAREAVKALKAERKDLVRALRTVDSVLAKLGVTVKRRRKVGRKAKAKAKTAPKRKPEPESESRPKAKAKKKAAELPGGPIDLEAKRTAARAARTAREAEE
jgi:hypothetical protein